MTPEEVERNQKECQELYEANLKLAREILACARRVEKRQEYWKGELEKYYATEAEEEAGTARLSKEVLEEEALALADGNFIHWMAKREVYGVGVEGIQAWYDNEALLALTPYLVAVPYPRFLSEEGKQMIATTLKGFQLPFPVYLQTMDTAESLASISDAVLHPLPPERREFFEQQARGLSKSNLLPLVDDSVQKAVQENSPHGYVQVKCGSSQDIMDLIAATPKLLSSLDVTNCLFVNERLLKADIAVQCIIVGGYLIAAQLTTGHAHDPQWMEYLSTSQQFGRQLKAFVDLKMLQSTETLLQHRSFVATLVANSRPNAEATFLLLNINTLSGTDMECFTLQEILMLAQYHTRRCSQKDVVVSLPPVIRILGQEALSRTPTGALAKELHATEQAASILAMANGSSEGDNSAAAMRSKEFDESLKASATPAPHRTMMASMVLAGVAVAAAALAVGLTLLTTRHR